MAAGTPTSAQAVGLDFYDASVVRDKHVGTASGISDLASDRDGGGLESWVGTLTNTNPALEDKGGTGAIDTTATG